MEDESTISAARFAVLAGDINCHACRAPTPVSGLLLPGKLLGEEEDSRMYSEDPVLLRYIRRLNSEAETAWRERAPWLKWVKSRTADSVYLANTCTKCGALQGDWFIGEPGAPFFPTALDDVKLLRVEWVEIPVVAECDGAQSSWMSEVSG